MNGELGGINLSWDCLCAHIDRPYPFPSPHHMTGVCVRIGPLSHLAGLVAYLN
jgi:hypothetical protein